jgi:hypothetical protein
MPKDFTEADCNKIYNMFDPIIKTLDKGLNVVVAKKEEFAKRGKTAVTAVHDSLVTQKKSTGNLCIALMNKAPVRMFRFGSPKIILTRLTL